MNSIDALRAASGGIAVVAVLFAGGLARAQQEIHWYVADFSKMPNSIARNVQLGLVDIVLNQELIPNLKAYTQSVDTVPLARRNSMLGGLDPLACSPGVVKTLDRAKQHLFSVPYMATHAQGAFVSKSNLPAFAPFMDKAGALDLTKLLADSKTMVGIANGRSYGEKLDGLLNNYRQSPLLQLVSTARPIENLLAMLRLGRIHLTLGYPFESSEAMEDRDKAESTIVFLPLQGQDRYVMFHAACANSPAGRQAIEAINQVTGSEHMRNTVAVYYQGLLPSDLQKDAIRLRQQAVAEGKFK